MQKWILKAVSGNFGTCQGFWTLHILPSLKLNVFQRRSCSVNLHRWMIDDRSMRWYFFEWKQNDHWFQTKQVPLGTYVRYQSMFWPQTRVPQKQSYHTGTYPHTCSCWYLMGYCTAYCTVPLTSHFSIFIIISNSRPWIEIHYCTYRKGGIFLYSFLGLIP